jgi:hypothetical protein
MDPDNDGFIITFEDAEKFNKNMNILHFIRKYIISNSSRLFMSGLQSLIEASNNNNNTDINNINYSFYPFTGNLPENWNFSQHDKGILNAVADNGFNFLNQISNNPNYNFNKIKINFEHAIDSINYLCEFFRDFSSGNKNKKKNLNIGISLNNNNISNNNNDNNINLNLNESGNTNENLNNNNIIKGTIKGNSIGIGNLNNNNNGNLTETITPIKTPSKNYSNLVEIPLLQNPSSVNKSIDYRRKNNKFEVKRDENGNIIYPIFINSSLQILNLGEIVYERISFHSEKNLFPVGFKSIREHSSMFKLGERTQYICEILNGGNKPLYKLTPIDDPENPIIKESSTGCWVIF